MELIIEELDVDVCNLNDELNFNLDKLNVSGYKEIPENVVVKKLQFNETIKPMMQQMPEKNVGVVREESLNLKPQISYDDILLKMGMFVSEGKLHLIGKDVDLGRSRENVKSIPKDFSRNIPKDFSRNIPQDSYIYNKYFKEELKSHPNIKRPMTKREYKMMLLEQILQKQRIKQMKSTKLIMPTSNINIASGQSSANLNKLFTFPKK